MVFIKELSYLIKWVVVCHTGISLCHTQHLQERNVKTVLKNMFIILANQQRNVI